MKILHFLEALCLFLLVSVSTWAYGKNVIVNGIHYEIHRYGYESQDATVIFPSNNYIASKAYKQKKIVLPDYIFVQKDYSEEFDTIPVVGIAEQAFMYAKNLESITLPSTLESIGCRAFYKCKKLRSLTIPKSVKSISTIAVHDCAALTSIVVDSGNTIYDSRENCNAIIHTELNVMVVACSTTTIPQSLESFAHPLVAMPLNRTEPIFSAEHLLGVPINYVGELHIPYGIKSLDLSMLADGVTALYIPSTVVEIFPSRSLTSQLSKIVVDDDNPRYDSRDSCNAILYKESGCVCIVCKGSVIPQSARSFACCTVGNAEVLHFPIGIERIYNTMEWLDRKNQLREIHMHSQVPIQLKRKGNLDNSSSKHIILYVPEGTKEAYLADPSYQGFMDIVEE